MASYQRMEYEAHKYSSSANAGACPKPTASYGHASGYSSAYGGGGSGSGFMAPGMSAMATYEQQAAQGARCGSSGGGPFCALVPSPFPPGTDPKFVDCFNRIDKDRSGLICDQELQSALSTFDQRFSMRTVHLLMFIFTASNSKVIGPKEFVPLVRSLQAWKATFQMYDRTRNGRLDERELKDALQSMCFSVSPFVLRLLMSKFAKSGATCGVEYDYYIECCLVVKGLTEKFKSKEDSYCGTASFTCDEFLLSVLPFIVA